jgi:uncharacterized glyoxalase superfamily protein PhnB
MPIQATTVTPLLEVYDMRRSVAFYCDAMGFEMVQKYEPDGHLYWAMLRLGGALIMLNARYEDDDPDRPATPPTTTLREDVTLYFACPDVDAAYQHARDNGLGVKPPTVAYYGMKQFHVTDPDGFVLCFQQPADTTAD